MSLHLVIPGLLWPKAAIGGPSAGLELPALETLLGHAAHAFAPALALEAWLARSFGLDGETLPYAALRRLGEDEPPAAGADWLCADPVHLHFAREHLLLADAGDLGITQAEADELVGALNTAFIELGSADIRIEATAPTRWYLRLAAPPKARFFPLNDVASRPIAQFLPEGEGARDWQRLMNEAQVILHNHPLNRTREAAGKRTVNSIWLWGEGALPQGLEAPAAQVFAAAPLARGLARAAGKAPQAPAGLPGDDSLVLLDSLQRPALYLDLDAWRDALAALERECFAPLLAALEARRVRRVRISAPGDRAVLELTLDAGALWKFWRRPRTLDALTKLAP